MDIGGRLRRLRLEAGLTQRELAAPRYTAAYVSTIEAGKRQPSRDALTHFAGRLEVDPDELLSGRSPRRSAELMAELVGARRELASGSPTSIDVADHSFRTVAGKARRERFIDVQGKALVGRAMCAEARNDLDGALHTYEEALRLLRDEGPLARIDAVVGRARVLQSKGEIAHAAFLIEQALAELNEHSLHDPAALLRLYSSLVAAYFDAGLPDKASDASERALELAVSVEDPERLANMNLNVGIMLADQGQWRDAETRLAEAQRWFDELAFEIDLARVRLVRGINLRNQQRYDEARAHLEAAREIFVRAGNALREARSTLHLGILERLAGRPDEATFLLKRAIALSGEDKGIAGMAERELALCHRNDERAKAVTGLRKAIRLLEEAGIADELAATYRALGDVLSEDKELKPACDAYRKAADLFERAA